MPTAGRLAGAVLFGLFGWYLATITVPAFPEGRPPGYWFPVSILFGVVIGWRICGARAGYGLSRSTGLGLTMGPLLAFCMVFALAFDQMVKNAMRLRYDGPTAAIIDTFALIAEKAVDFYTSNLVITILVGGLVCAWITEIVARRLP
ncbi:TrgA family protein [Yoonia sp.]|uniref:TrgA family protein n=1 Tax=Yoonia sp. TaxID=2212373 RepID=UPI002FD88063